MSHAFISGLDVTWTLLKKRITFCAASAVSIFVEVNQTVRWYMLAPEAKSHVPSDWAYVGNPLKQSSNYVYHILTDFAVCPHNICMFYIYMVLTVNSDYFPKLH
jgi:hypothetical protein